MITSGLVEPIEIVIARLQAVILSLGRRLCGLSPIDPQDADTEFGLRRGRHDNDIGAIGSHNAINTSAGMLIDESLQYLCEGWKHRHSPVGRHVDAIIPSVEMMRG